MIRFPIACGLVAAVVLAAPSSLRAQETPPSARTEAPRPVVDEAQIRHWIDQLGADEHELRRDAERALRDAGGAARGALEKAVEETDDPEIRWRARRVLKSIDGAKSGLERREESGQEPQVGGPEPVAPPRGEGTDQRIQQMLEQFQRSFGPEFGRLHGIEDLQRQIEAMQRQMQELEGRAGEGLRIGGGPAQQMQMQVGPDGVKLEVREPDETGTLVPKTYEAESLEAFREKYPEVAKRYFDGDGSMRIDGAPFGIGPDRLLRGWRILPGQPDRNAEPVEIIPPTEPNAPPPEGERLGIYVGDLAPAVREFLGVEPGQGLLVSRVEPGSLAEALGVRPKDVVLRIGENPVANTADVRAALRTIQAGQPVDVVVNRLGQSVQLSAEKQHDAPAPVKGLKRRTPAPEQVERR